MKPGRWAGANYGYDCHAIELDFILEEVGST